MTEPDPVPDLVREHVDQTTVFARSAIGTDLVEIVRSIDDHVAIGARVATAGRIKGET